MPTKGLEGFFIGTHNWGAAAAFWQGLGFELEFETDHHSGQLRHPNGGPYILLAERPENEALEIHPVISVDDASAFQPPSSSRVERSFAAQHWGVLEMILLDPDGRPVSVQAPLPEGVNAADHA